MEPSPVIALYNFDFKKVNEPDTVKQGRYKLLFAMWPKGSATLSFFKFRVD